MGTVNPLGLSVKESWENALNGVSGVGPITLFDSSRLLVRIACEVKGFKPENYMEPKEARRRDRYEQIAAAAAKEAIAQAGLQVGEDERGRVGVVVSSAIGGIATIHDLVVTSINEGPRRISPFTIPMIMANGAAGLISIDYGFRGPSLSVASACASGIDGIGTAWMLLKAGMIDVAVTGGSEATITEVGVGAFDRVGAMSRRNEDYSQTPQPFDLNRDGLVMGEGAAVLVLEREGHARKRGAEIMAELAGYGATADAFHITAPAEDGSGGAAAIRQAMASASVSPEQLGYINAHGTGTMLNDISETKAIKSALGPQAYKIPVSSTKSMTGHMMGATGALETIFCVQAVQTGALPPTIHYQTPDPNCDLDYLPNQALERKIEVAINNAFGFGGHNAVLVVRAYR
ncbi:MAG: beta-ketoacyl-[acyl-carrier-protein] synthase II [Chloroflexi bacterium RBG_16_57_11]|nr:MAG: beta-ketoacyl-[acyl-carrier-protein] synthase II [Chloroflexi bacterium RBG_16_57_11]